MTQRNKATRPDVQSPAALTKHSLEFFKAAIGKPTTDPTVQKVVKALGGDYEVNGYKPSEGSYDPDVARTLRWEFTRVPAANYHPTHLRVIDDVVVGMSLHVDLVSGGHNKAVVLDRPCVEQIVLQYDPEKGRWAPSVIQRAGQFLFDLVVPLGHWDGNYKFPLTANQVEALTSRETWQTLWDELALLCQSSKFADPTKLPVDAQRIIDKVCGPATGD